MNSVKPLAARFYQLKFGHAPVRTYLKGFGHPDHDRSWWCRGGGRTVAQTQEHLFGHFSPWKDRQRTLRKKVRKATGWRAGRCRHVQVFELLSVEKCYRAVMDFLAANHLG